MGGPLLLNLYHEKHEIYSFYINKKLNWIFNSRNIWITDHIKLPTLWFATITFLFGYKSYSMR